jgi:MoaA/NifB/PqqE/SkfB family radical SAM enzyme
MQYDVEADFVLLTTCNFRCSYCFIPVADLSIKLRVHATNEAWQEAFDATGRRWLIHLTGGEPFLYPNFVDLCARLSQRHHVSINSNLAHASIEKFAGTIDPARVHFINAALHFDEREQRGGCDAFIARARMLKDSGFTTFVSLVMTPAAIESFTETAKRFDAEGLPLVPKTLRGPFEGMDYPKSYSPQHKAMLREFLAAAREKCANVTGAMNERPTLDMLGDDRHLDGFPDYHGRMCASGQRFVQIYPDGTVHRCGSGQRLGNLLKHDLRLLGEPARCDTSYCPYWCEKYTSPRFVGNAWSRDVPLTVLSGRAVAW